MGYPDYARSINPTANEDPADQKSVGSFCTYKPSQAAYRKVSMKHRHSKVIKRSNNGIRLFAGKCMALRTERCGLRSKFGRGNALSEKGIETHAAAHCRGVGRTAKRGER